jgi:hypothetical protein
MRDVRNAYRISMGKSKRKTPVSNAGMAGRIILKLTL